MLNRQDSFDQRRDARRCFQVAKIRHDRSDDERMLRGFGIDVETDVRCGPAPDVIIEAAEGLHISMIAMATHGYSGLRRWALGSVTDRVVHATATPVFVVRGAKPAPVDPVVFKRVMVPLDGSPLAAQALPLAADLAERARAELLLMQAVEETNEIYPVITSEEASRK